ncbi:MAG: dTDP-4-dehydrorhamnose reductase [Desulfurispora sp.]|uniref:dTDP-4-dehydrorhamnose reductase n=1 Tax=Desulfurispora sp. TaxID=3014275 RepID=UPI00404B4404
MKILLLGKNGQVGWELAGLLPAYGTVVALGRSELDLMDFDAVIETVRRIKPRLIINAAAYTAVERAEREPQVAMAINGIAPGVLALETRRLGAALIHYSTDYVFDGRKNTPYTEQDLPAPLNTYGLTKWAGELAVSQVGAPHIILRTSWVYSSRGQNFLRTMLRLAREQEILRVVNDQVGVPTWSRYIARVTMRILQLGGSDPVGFLQQYGGIYHLTAAGQTTWYDYACFLLAADPARHEQRLKQILPISSREYASKVIRPAYGVLGCDQLARLLGLPVPGWQAGVEQCLKESLTWRRGA